MEPKELCVNMPNRRGFLDQLRVSRSRKLLRNLDGIETDMQLIICDDFGAT